MAVRFKVPASPKKNVYAIDEFYGVDLTNIGSSVDDTRSPNAENMVRWTPGKVRKRTGYKTKIQFSTPEDINRIKHSTSEEQVFHLEEGESLTIITLYEDKSPDGFDPWIYLEWEAKGKWYIYAYYESVGQRQIGYCSSSHFYFDWPICEQGYEGLYAIEIKFQSRGSTPLADTFFKFRNARVCYSSVTTDTWEFRALPWTPSPEDTGLIWALTDSNYPIYGCHKLITGNIEENRVVNVNRALGTSNEWVEYNLPQMQSTPIELYTIPEQCYIDTDGNKRKVHISFDYIVDAYMYLYVYDGSSDTQILEFAKYSTTPLEGHYEIGLELGSVLPYKIGILQVHHGAGGQAVTIQIKNFSLTYDHDDNYEWSAAPEDNGEVFPIGDIYNVIGKNYWPYENLYKSATVSGSEGILTFIIQHVSRTAENAKGFVKISMDVATSCNGELTSIEVSLLDRDDDEVPIPIQIFYDEINQRIEFYGCALGQLLSNYIYKIKFKFNFVYTIGDVEIGVSVSNIKIQKVTAKDYFDVSPKNYIYHVGPYFYMRRSGSSKVIKMYSNANQQTSNSWQLNDVLYIQDGRNLYRYLSENDSIEVIANSGYIPLISIGKAPNGGGISYEPVNMLQPGFYDQFTVDSAHAESHVFNLSLSGLDKTEVIAWVLDSNGEWQEKTEEIDFIVSRPKGQIYFTEAPGETPITGEDNVRILAYKTIPEYRDRITQCTIGTLFGVNGEADRLFFSGNPDYPNWDFYSQQYDPTYFPDTGYSVLGSSSSAITGYSVLNNYLVTFKDGNEASRVAFIRQGNFLKNEVTGLEEPYFKLINTLQGNGVVSRNAFGYLETEPLFLTKKGVYAITSQDITGKEYSQSRSFYLDGSLEKEQDLKNAFAVVFDNQYILAINDKLYILDGLQATRSDRSEPYATRQYAGFLCTNVPANVIWEDEDALWIGTKRGRICRFDTDIESSESYNDDGEPIYCCWETPDLDGHLFYKNKSFRYLALRMMASIRTSVKIFSRKLGNWSFIKEDRSTGTWFDFEHIDFEFFSFNTDRSERVAHTKVRVKKVDKARFRIENGRLNEPFGLVDLALEYIENGNYKG